MIKVVFLLDEDMNSLQDLIDNAIDRIAEIDIEIEKIDKGLNN